MHAVIALGDHDQAEQEDSNCVEDHCPECNEYKSECTCDEDPVVPNAGLTATYSPEDDKLRLRSFHRLPNELYKSLTKGAGFQWAPKQELLYAIWTPGREDRLLELCSEIGDEDTSLVERAEQRAERFEEYHENRAEDAERAYGRFKEISSGIPLGQPILVGHHSERRARRDARKIEDAVRQAVKMWDTATYWQSRAAGALRHAKNKQRPDVRYRRIKGLESDLRKEQKNKELAELGLRRWTDVKNQTDDAERQKLALYVANNLGRNPTLPRKEGDRADLHSPDAGDALTGHGVPQLWAPRTLDEIIDHCLRVYPNGIAYRQRWITHIENRLLYERAMLDEAGGDPGKRFDFAVGGRVLTRSEWRIITRINQKDGKVLSLSSNRFTVPVEDVKDYRAPTPEEVERVKAATKLPPMCNYAGENFLHMAKAEWDRLYKDSRGSETVKASEQYGEHRVRRRFGVGFKQHLVFLTDAKVVTPPLASQVPLEKRPVLTVERDVMSEPPAYQRPPRTVFTLPEQLERKLSAEVNRFIECAGGRWNRGRKTHVFEPDSKRVLAQAIATGVLNTADVNAATANFRPGVQAVVVPGLFPTPMARANLLVKACGVQPGHRVLEPEAGTGNLVRAILLAFMGADCGRIVAVEVNDYLAEALRQQQRLTLYANDDNFTVLHRDFLDCTVQELGMFDRIVMNPPFEKGQDAAHIRHAFDFLKPGGQLAAIACEGPFYRQDRASSEFRAWLEEKQATTEKLPDDTFKESGTSVSTRMVTLTRPRVSAPEVIKRIPGRKEQPVHG